MAKYRLEFVDADNEYEVIQTQTTNIEPQIGDSHSIKTQAYEVESYTQEEIVLRVKMRKVSQESRTNLLK